MHFFVSDVEGPAGDNATKHYYSNGAGWVLHDSIENIVIQDITQLDDQSFGILGHNLVNNGIGLLISRNTVPNGSVPGIQNYKVASDIHIDDDYRGGVNISSIEISPGEYQVTYSQYKDKSAVYMKHLTIKQSSSDPDKYDVVQETSVGKVHEDATDVTSQVNFTLKDGSGVIAYSTYIESSKREQVFAKIFNSDGVVTVSEFKVSDGNNRTDTITGIVPIDNEGSEAIGFLHYAGNYNAGMAGSLSLTVADTNGNVLNTYDLYSPSETPDVTGYYNPVLEQLEGGDYLLSWFQAGGAENGQYAQVLNYTGSLADQSSFTPKSDVLKITSDTHGSFGRGQETKGMFAQGQDDEYLSYWDISGSSGNVMQYTFEGLSLNGKNAAIEDNDGWEDYLEADASGLDGGMPINVGGKDFNLGVGLWDGSDVSVRIDNGSVDLYRIGYNPDKIIHVDSGLLGQSYTDLSQVKIWTFGNKGILGVTHKDNFYWRTIELQATGEIPADETGVTYGEINTIPHSLSQAGFSLENVKLRVFKSDDAGTDYSAAKFVLENTSGGSVTNQEVDIFSILSVHAPDFFKADGIKEPTDVIEEPIGETVEPVDNTATQESNTWFWG